MLSKNRLLLPWVELLFLFVLIFSFRLYATVLVENSGDSFVKWFEVKRLYHDLDFSRLDHHTMRWGINFLCLFFQKVFGTQPSTYFLPSAFAATGAALFLYRIGIILRGRLLGLSILLLFTLHPSIIAAGGQLFPGIFSIFYILGAVYFVLKYGKIERVYFLLLSSLFLFFAYGAKMTNLFFLPAIVGYLYWKIRRLKPVALYILVLFAGFCVETIIIDTLLQDYSFLGRLSLAGGHMHFVESGLVGEKTLWGILTRWQMLPAYTYVHTVTGFFAIFYLLTRARQYEQEILLSLCFLSFAFLITFGFCSIDPVRYLLPHEPRYLNVTIPFTLFLTLDLADRLGKKCLIMALLLLTVPYPLYMSNLGTASAHRQFFKINAYQKQVMSYLNQGYGILFFDEKNARLYRDVFVDDSLSMGFNKDDSVNVYIMRPGQTLFNHTRYMYVLSLIDDEVSKGIVRPYPNQYKLKVDNFAANQEHLLLSSGEGILW